MAPIGHQFHIFNINGTKSKTPQIFAGLGFWLELMEGFEPSTCALRVPNLGIF